MSEEIKETKNEEFAKKLEECEKKAAEYLDGWQRARADFLNYKKEEAERIGEVIKFACESWTLKLLPIIDNFDLAEKTLPEKLKDEQYLKGIMQIKMQLLDFLKGQGVEPIKTLGEKFDPNLEEVVQIIEEKEKQSGIILEEVQKGYKMADKTIRPAKVKISK